MTRQYLLVLLLLSRQKTQTDGFLTLSLSGPHSKLKHAHQRRHPPSQHRLPSLTVTNDLSKDSLLKLKQVDIDETEFSPDPSENNNGSTESFERKNRRWVDYPYFYYEELKPYKLKGKAGTFDEQRSPSRLRVRIRRLSPPEEPDDSMEQKRAYYYNSQQPIPDFPLSSRAPFGVDAILANIEEAASESRLLRNRAYAKPNAFTTDRLEAPPNIDDIASVTKPELKDIFWIGAPARILTFVVSFLLFPYVMQFLRSVITLPSNSWAEEIAGKLGPGISILYGTFLSLTLSILYTRQRDIQEYAAEECSQLIVLTRNLLTLFRKHPTLALEAGQCSADQVRTLVRSTRGMELMTLVYSDPYARMMELLDRLETEPQLASDDEIARVAALLGHSRNVLSDVMGLRAKRLSEEALAIPKTHMLVLQILTLLVLLGFCLGVLPTVVDSQGDLRMGYNESAIIFGILTTTYLLFYNFANDLRDPFGGVYQIRRSTTASHLLQLKWLLVHHPLLKGQVDFEAGFDADTDAENKGDVGDGTGKGSSRSFRVQSPGLGECCFQAEEAAADAGLMQQPGNTKK